MSNLLCWQQDFLEKLEILQLFTLTLHAIMRKLFNLVWWNESDEMCDDWVAARGWFVMKSKCNEKSVKQSLSRDCACRA